MMKYSLLWDIIRLAIALLFIIKYLVFASSKDGLIRKIFMASSAVMAYYFISYTVFAWLKVDEEIIALCSCLPVFVVLLTDLYLIRGYALKHKDELPVVDKLPFNKNRAQSAIIMTNEQLQILVDAKVPFNKIQLFLTPEQVKALADKGEAEGKDTEKIGDKTDLDSALKKGVKWVPTEEEAHIEDKDKKKL